MTKPKVHRGVVYAVKVDAQNDTCGNPRRCWWVFDRTGTVVGTVDERYTGRQLLTGRYPKVIEALQLNVTPGDYRACRNFVVDPPRPRPTQQRGRFV